MRETTYSYVCVEAIRSMHDSFHEAGIPVIHWSNYLDTQPMLLAVQLTHVLDCVDPNDPTLQDLTQRTGG
jgi:hypothetical protein